MALQPYASDPGQALAVYQAQQITPEERQKRAEEAEKLDEKLRYIVEQVPDRMYHTMGSNAGAGSGEFHTYRHSRRREQERLARIEEEHEKAAKEKEHQDKTAKLQEEDEARTAKRRAKRLKKKEKQRAKRPRQDGSAADGGQQDIDGSGGDEQEGKGIEQAALD